MKKRILAIALAAALSASTLPASMTVFAETQEIVVVSGNSAAPGETVSAKTDGATAYQWKISDTADGEYTDITGATGEKLILTWEHASKYIKCAVTAGEETALTDALSVPVPSDVNLGNKDTVTISDWGQVENSAEADTFIVDGKKYTLADVFNNDESTFYVVAQDSYGNMYWDLNGTVYFDPTKAETLAYYMNNDLMNELPASLTEHIDKDYAWITEKTKNNSTYTVKTGIIAPAQWELKKYKDVIGYKDPGEKKRWFLRTRHQDSNDAEDGSRFVFSYSYPSLWGRTAYQYYHVSYKDSGDKAGARPQFMLDKQYFLEHRPDSLGEKVLEKLGKVYTLNEVAQSELYTTAEMTAMGFDTSELGIITPIVVSGNDAAPGETLKITDDGITAYQWQISDNAKTGFTDIEGATKNTFVITWEHLGKYIKCTVTKDGTEKESEIAHVVTEVEGVNLGLKTGVNDLATNGYRKTTDPDYTFTVDGKDYALADTFNNDESTFFVVANDLYGSMYYDLNGTVVFDPTKEGSLAYYMNNDLMELLPETLTDHIDKDYAWINECYYRDSAGKATRPAYTVKAAIAAPAMWEFEKYKDILGYDDNEHLGSARKYYLRSPHQDLEVNDFYYQYTDFWGATTDNFAAGQTTNSALKCAARPEFMLDKQYFLEHRPERMGAKALKQLKNVYTLDEIAGCGLYNITEIANMGFDVSSLETKVSEVSAKIRSGAATAEIGDTLIGSYKFLGSGADNTACAWYTSEDKDGLYTKYADGKEFIVTVREAGKYYRFATVEKNADNKETVTLSDPIAIPEKTLVENVETIWEVKMADAGINADSAESNIFTFGGSKYVMLDNFDNDKSTFLIVANRIFMGDYNYSPNGGKVFDPTEEGSLAKKLNTYTEDGDATGNLIPKAVHTYINKDAVWITEPGYQESDPTYVTAGVVVPSVSEYYEYKDVLGYSVSGTWGSWTRTPWNKPDKAMVDVHFENQQFGAQTSSSTCGVRPMFMLTKEFFVNNIVDPSAMGSAVKKAVMDTYEKSELQAAGYTEDQLVEIGYEPEEITYTNSTIINYNSTTKKLIVALKLASSFEGTFSVNADVYFAGYDENGKMIQSDVKKNQQLDFANGDTKPTYTLDDWSNASTYKVFIWESGSLKPLCTEKVK